jgi:Thoeris protein ThsB, TIR-like domain
MNWHQNSASTKHKVFISFYHRGDQYYRNEFERLFSHLFISKSVEPGDMDSDLSDEYIKRLIQEGYLTDSSVVLVLVGPKTYCRKHVDWEISAGLNKKVGGYSGLVGILLPEFPLSADNKYIYSDIPPRLADNVKSGYAEIYTWDYACGSDAMIKSVIQTAFDNRISKADKIDNSRVQYSLDICS